MTAPSASNFFRRPSFIGHVYLFFFSFSFCSQHATDLFFTVLSLHPVLICICPHVVPQVVCVPFFFFLLYILGVVLLLLTKLTSSFTLLFPIFFCLFMLPA